MACDFPLKAFPSATERGPSGKPLLTFNPLEAINSTSPMEIPCNNCIGCKLERARQWSIRMMHESKCWDQNCFITLTYDDQNVPQDYSLNLRHLQLFFKRLRQEVPQKIRYYACGEYGDLLGRPHYHAIVFNYDPQDKKPYSVNHNGQINYSSESLSRVWSHGHAISADVTHASCSYVARYCTKKIKSNDTYGANRYYRVSPIDGKDYAVRPEFAVMSRRPGLGSDYARRFRSDFFPSGFIVVDGIRQAPPKFYVSKLAEGDQLQLKRQSRRHSLKNKPHTTTERRLARAAVRDARIANLKRKLD